MPKKEKLLQIVLSINALSLSVALIAYAYLGLFSRYIADDYCHSGTLGEYGFWAAIQHHYLTFSNRYMILVVPYLTDLFGVRGQSYLPGIMIVLWVVALTWLLSEIRKGLSIVWSDLLNFLLAGSIAFFTILQAPNRYQSIYWEASSINRFVPLVLTTFLFASVFFVVRKHSEGRNLFMWNMLYFVITFLIGGFDEMNDVLIFAVAFLSFVGVFVWQAKDQKRLVSLWIIGSMLLSSLLSVGVMSLSPGISWRVKQEPTFFVFLQRIFTYPLDFMSDVLRRQPIPSALILFSSFLIFFLIYVDDKKDLTALTKRKVAGIIFLAPIILYSLLLVNFAPSAYAQAYPADRALLGAQALMTSLLLLEGGLLGFSLSQVQSKVFHALTASYLAFFLLVLFSFYPLRAAWQTVNTFDFYRQRAAAWDLRDAQIRADVDAGLTEIIVPEFDSLHGIKEIDSEANHWVNRCAARYYGVDTITAILP